ncbi:MAG: hypothetical protein DDT28_00458 [Dehalococcoidia bacterium]|nr:hypothetical protein [Chloroflexota bacterium]
MVLIFDRYFGIDVSAMSPEEFEEVGLSIGTEKVLRLFTQYAEKRGFEIPGRIPDPQPFPVKDEYVRPVPLTPADGYCLAMIRVACREAKIAMVREMFPELKPVELMKLMNMTTEELGRLLTPPPPPLRLLSPEERWGKFPGAPIAIYGRARSYQTQADIREWLDRLERVRHYIRPLLFSPHYPYMTLLGVCDGGYVWVGLNGARLTEAEARAFAAKKIYPLIAEKAEAMGIDEVPVVFDLLIVRLNTTLVAEGTPPAAKRYDEKHRPIIDPDEETPDVR